jgi:Ca2+-binding EF-hand superfamily protein|tara:strand:- start:5 stop:499 length:495 start_codon:yes stop_codon:yes gene_type:complete
MQYLKTKIIAASLIAGITAPAIAHERPAELDSDEDGLISRDEFRLPNDRRRQRMDINGDGSISQEEVVQHHAEADARQDERTAKRREKAAERFNEIDVDGDGSVTTQEAEDHAFTKLDKDRDGYISRQELRQKARKKARQERRKIMQRHGKRGGLGDRGGFLRD